MSSRRGHHSWRDVKATLERFSSAALVGLLRDLYRASADNRRFLHGRLLGSQAEIEKYRTLIADAVHPDPLSRKHVRIGEAERLIRHYRQATADMGGAVDLMITFVEAGTEQAADLGDGDEPYFAALERTLKVAVDAVPALPLPTQAAVAQRVRKVADRAAAVGWGYGDAVQEIAASLLSPRRGSARASRAAV